MYVSMDVSVIKDKSFLDTHSLQGENDVMEENFWDLSPIPLPNTILRTPPLIYNLEEQCDKIDKNSSHIVPNITISKIEREPVQPNTEHLVYTRRKTHQKSQNQPISLAPDITSSPTPNLPSIPIISSLDLDVPIAIRKGTRTCTKYLIAKYLSYKKLSKTHKDALDDPNWKVTLIEELVDLPNEKRTVSCNWVFTMKCKVDGSIERYKARIVVKGFTQTYAKINSIRILLSLVVNFNWPLH
ncbi:hypothetical protein AAG906_031240 [Vitis piasezkii]